MGRKMGAAYNTLTNDEKKQTLVFCDNYGQAGAVNYYGPRYQLPAAYSANASFLYWMPENIQYEHLVLLTDDEHEMEHAFIKNFRSALLFDSVTTPYARERGGLIIILKGADSTFKKFFADKMAKKRAMIPDRD